MFRSRLEIVPFRPPTTPQSLPPRMHRCNSEMWFLFAHGRQHLCEVSLRSRTHRHIKSKYQTHLHGGLVGGVHGAESVTEAGKHLQEEERGKGSSARKTTKNTITRRKCQVIAHKQHSFAPSSQKTARPCTDTSTHTTARAPLCISRQQRSKRLANTLSLH